MWCYGVGGKGALYSTMIRSLSFSEPVSLNCDFHKCVSAFSPLGETKSLKEAGIEYFPSTTSVRLW